MKKENRLIKVIVCIFLITTIFSSFSTITFAAINKSYGTNAKVNSQNIDSKVESSTLLDLIGSLIYGTAASAEALVGKLFSLVTGSNTFPWADKVIFNGIPFLDINFFNPAKGSLFRDSNGETLLSKVVRKVYFTVLSLSIGFLSVIVGIMAIKLAISTVAAEKAKYKEALLNWLFAIVMIFLVHFLLAAVFFVNEKMVEIANGLISSKLYKVSELIEINTLDGEGADINGIEFSNLRYNLRDSLDKFYKLYSDYEDPYTRNSRFFARVFKLF